MKPFMKKFWKIPADSIIIATKLFFMAISNTLSFNVYGTRCSPAAQRHQAFGQQQHSLEGDRDGHSRAPCYFLFVCRRPPVLEPRLHRHWSALLRTHFLLRFFCFHVGGV